MNPNMTPSEFSEAVDRYLAGDLPSAEFETLCIAASQDETLAEMLSHALHFESTLEVMLFDVANGVKPEANELPLDLIENISGSSESIRHSDSSGFFDPPDLARVDLMLAGMLSEAKERELRCDAHENSVLASELAEADRFNELMAETFYLITQPESPARAGADLVDRYLAGDLEASEQAQLFSSVEFHSELMADLDLARSYEVLMRETLCLVAEGAESQPQRDDGVIRLHESKRSESDTSVLRRKTEKSDDARDSSITVIDEMLERYLAGSLKRSEISVLLEAARSSNTVASKLREADRFVWLLRDSFEKMTGRPVVLRSEAARALQEARVSHRGDAEDQSEYEALQLADSSGFGSGFYEPHDPNDADVAEPLQLMEDWPWERDPVAQKVFLQRSGQTRMPAPRVARRRPFGAPLSAPASAVQLSRSPRSQLARAAAMRRRRSPVPMIGAVLSLLAIAFIGAFYFLNQAWNQPQDSGDSHNRAVADQPESAGESPGSAASESTLVDGKSDATSEQTNDPKLIEDNRRRPNVKSGASSEVVGRESNTNDADTEPADLPDDGKRETPDVIDGSPAKAQPGREVRRDDTGSRRDIEGVVEGEGSPRKGEVAPSKPEGRIPLAPSVEKPVEPEDDTALERRMLEVDPQLTASQVEQRTLVLQDTRKKLRDLQRADGTFELFEHNENLPRIQKLAHIDTYKSQSLAANALCVQALIAANEDRDAATSDAIKRAVNGTIQLYKSKRDFLPNKLEHVATRDLAEVLFMLRAYLKVPSRGRSNRISYSTPTGDIRQAIKEIVETLVERQNRNNLMWGLDNHELYNGVAGSGQSPNSVAGRDLYTDMHTTYFAVMGLDAADDLGLFGNSSEERELMAGVARKLMDFQSGDGPIAKCIKVKWEDGSLIAKPCSQEREARGWTYSGFKNHYTEGGPLLRSGAATASAVAMLTAIRVRLADSKELDEDELSDIDRSIGDGLAWLSRYYTIQGNPCNDNGSTRSWLYSSGHHLYLRAMSESLSRLSCPVLGEHSWFADMNFAVTPAIADVNGAGVESALDTQLKVRNDAIIPMRYAHAAVLLADRQLMSSDGEPVIPKK